VELSDELREALEKLRDNIANDGEQVKSMRDTAPDLWGCVMRVLAVWASERKLT